MISQRVVSAEGEGFSTWLGFGGKSFRWEAPLWFLAAFLYATEKIVVGGLAVTTRDWLASFRTPDDAYLAYQPGRDLVDFLRRLVGPFPTNGPDSWFGPIIQCLLLLGLAALLLRFVRNRTVALVTAAVVGTLATPVVADWLVRPENRLSDALIDYDWRSLRIWFPLVVCSGALALALRRFRSVRAALLTGAVTGALLPELLVALASHAMPDAARVFWGLTRTFIFVGLLWLGRWLQSEVPSTVEPRLLRGFYLGTLAAANGLLIFLVSPLLVMDKEWEAGGLLPAVTVSAVFTFLQGYAITVMALLVYRMWAAIQDDDVRTTPGRAVGFLFIPVFNSYWAFRAFPGFARNFNTFASRHGVSAVRLSPGLFMAYALLAVSAGPVLVLTMLIASATRSSSVVYWWSYCFILVSWSWCCVLLAMVSKICDAVNSIPENLSSGAPIGEA